MTLLREGFEPAVSFVGETRIAQGQPGLQHYVAELEGLVIGRGRHLHAVRHR